MNGGSGPPVEVPIRRLESAIDMPFPERATEEASGFDLRARIDGSLELVPGERRLIPSGIAIALPPGYEAQVRPRSGLALKYGLTLLNSPGTVDSDYRGEVGVILINLGGEPVRIERGDRIAQLVVQRVPGVRFREVQALPETQRGAGGFGHTGR